MLTEKATVTCDANEKITSVDAQWPGSIHDSRIWRQSGIQDVVRIYEGDDCLLGDSGYGITLWLFTPFDGLRNVIEQNFNSTHAQERVFG